MCAASGKTVTLSAKENTTGEDRQQDFIITVQMNDGQKASQIFTAYQTATVPLEILVAGGNEKHVDANENILEIGIWTNCDTFTAKSDAGWLKATADVEGSKVIIKAEENKGDERTGHVVLTGSLTDKISGKTRTVEVEITVSQDAADQGYAPLWGTWKHGDWTVTFGKNGSYKYDAGSYTQTGSYTITSWKVVSSGDEKGEIHGKLDETHVTSSTGKSKTNTNVTFWISADGKKLNYMNYSWTKK